MQIRVSDCVTHVSMCTSRDLSWHGVVLAGLAYCFIIRGGGGAVVVDSVQCKGVSRHERRRVGLLSVEETERALCRTRRRGGVIEGGWQREKAESTV